MNRTIKHLTQITVKPTPGMREAPHLRNHHIIKNVGVLIHKGWIQAGRPNFAEKILIRNCSKAGEHSTKWVKSGQINWVKKEQIE